MAITREDVVHLAELSNISLAEDQIEPLIKDLDNILGYISQLDELDTDNVEPTYQCFDMQNVWREDEIEEFEAKREDLLALTRESEDNQIKVPKVLLLPQIKTLKPSTLCAKHSRRRKSLKNITVLSQ